MRTPLYTMELLYSNPLEMRTPLYTVELLYSNPLEMRTPLYTVELLYSNPLEMRTPLYTVELLYSKTLKWVYIETIPFCLRKSSAIFFWLLSSRALASFCQDCSMSLSNQYVMTRLNSLLGSTPLSSLRPDIIPVSIPKFSPSSPALATWKFLSFKNIFILRSVSSPPNSYQKGFKFTY